MWQNSNQNKIHADEPKQRNVIQKNLSSIEVKRKRETLSFSKVQEYTTLA